VREQLSDYELGINPWQRSTVSCAALLLLRRLLATAVPLLPPPQLPPASMSPLLPPLARLAVSHPFPFDRYLRAA